MRPSRLVLLSLMAVPAFAAEDPKNPAAPVASAERAFAKRCGEVGIRASFLEFFPPEAVSFNPEPGNAHQRITSRPAPPSPPPISLEWGPEQAEATPAGDMGWTTGPSRFSDKRDPSKPAQTGYYFSVWKKQTDGAYKVVLDLGVDMPAGAVPGSADLLPPPKADKTAGGDEAVRKRDEELCKATAVSGAKGYGEALAANARVHRAGQAPAVGAKAKEWAKALGGKVVCQPMAAFASNPPALGYSYGSYERPDAGEKGFYARVWRWEGSGWKLAADVLTTGK